MITPEKGKFYVVNIGTHLNDIGYFCDGRWQIMFEEIQTFSEDGVEVLREIDMSDKEG